MQLDLNFVLAVASILMFAGFLAFFGYLIFHQQSLEPPEKTGAELIEQHYAAGETIEQPTPYYVAPIPAAPDPLEISANLDRKILVGAGMLFAVFAARPVSVRATRRARIFLACPSTSPRSSTTTSKAIRRS